MSKLIRLSKTGIEYADYAWNFASGCANNIGGKCKSGGFPCWAHAISQRFPSHYPVGFKPIVYPDAFLSPLYLKKPSRILCAFMGDLFGEGFDPEQKVRSMLPSGIGSIVMSLKGWIFTTIKQCPQHTFLFLTKQPQNLPRWSPFPDNCWVGVTVCTNGMMTLAMQYLSMIKAKVKYISFEPLLGAIGMSDHMSLKSAGIKWAIQGAQTKPYKPPEIEWVREIVKVCDRAGVAVFLKDNLLPGLGVHIVVTDEYSDIRQPYWWGKWVDVDKFKLRQELPNLTEG